MRAATYMAFLDELAQIKEAGMLSNLGTKALTAIKSAPRATVGAIKATPGALRGGIRNAGSAVSAFATPVDSFKRGLTTSVRDFKSLSTPMKAMMGLGLATSAHEAIAKEDPLGKGRGRVERVGAALGDQLGGIVGSPFGLAGGLVAGQIGRKAGGMVGKGVEKVRALRAASRLPETELG